MAEIIIKTGTTIASIVIECVKPIVCGIIEAIINLIPTHVFEYCECQPRKTFLGSKLGRSHDLIIH